MRVLASGILAVALVALALAALSWATAPRELEVKVCFPEPEPLLERSPISFDLPFNEYSVTIGCCPGCGPEAYRPRERCWAGLNYEPVCPG